MAAITSPDFPGERLIVCRNPDLARERARKREDLLAATERDLAKIAAAVARKTQPLRGAAEIGLAVGAVLDKHKMAKHFELTISDAQLRLSPQDRRQIAAEAALDGLYAVRTSLPEETLDDAATVARLQILVHGGARLSLPEDGRPARPPDPPLAGGSRPRPRVPVHARLLRRMAHARAPRPDALRRRRQRGRRGPARQPRRQGATLARRPRQERHRTHRRRRSPSTASRACSPISRPSRATPSSPPIAPDRPFTILTRPTPIQQKAFDLLGPSHRLYPVATRPEIRLPPARSMLYASRKKEAPSRTG